MKIQKTHGQPINGSLKPIKGTEFELLLEEIKNAKHDPDLNSIQRARDLLKKVVAIYFLYSIRSIPFKTITTQSIQTLTNESANYASEESSNFIRCAIRYFNENIQNDFNIILTIPECNSNKLSSALQQAKKNSEKILSTYFKVIIQKMKSKEWKNIDEPTKMEFEAIPRAIEIFSIYISALFIESLPKQISESTYQKALNMESHDKNINLLEKKSIKDVYPLYDQGKKVYCQSKTYKYSSISMECATVIFCFEKLRHYKFKSNK